MPSSHEILFNIKVDADTASLGRAANQLRSQFSGFKVGADASGLTKLSTAATASQTSLRQLQSTAAAANTTLALTAKVSADASGFLANMASQAGLALRRFTAFTLAAGSMLTVVSALKSGVKAAVEFDLSLNKLAQVGGDTGSQIGAIRDEITRLSTTFGISSSAIAETTITLRQAGLSAEQTRKALQALALTDLAPSFGSQKEATEGFIAALQQFKLQSRDYEGALGSINAVSAQFAVESKDIISAIQKAGGAFASVAGSTKPAVESLAEFQGLFTSVRATTRESADSIATGLRTIFARLQRGDTVDQLKDLGVNLRYTREEAESLGQTDLTNQFVGAFEAVKRLSEGLKDIRTTDPRYSNIIEQLGGYRQISRVIPLLQQFGDAEKAKNVALAGGNSLQLAAEKRQEALATKVAKTKEEYLDLARKLVDSKGFQTLASSLLSVAGSFAKIVEFASPLLPILAGLAAAKVSSSLFSAVSGFGRSFIAPVGSSGASPRKFSSGGTVSGVGDRDTVPALLTPGEFVLNRRAVSTFGVGVLNEMNERGVRKFATGGLVGEDGDERKRRLLEKLRAKQGDTTARAEVGASAEGFVRPTPAPDLTPEQERAERARIDRLAEARAFAEEQAKTANKSFEAKILSGLTPEGSAFFAANYEKALAQARALATKANVDFANRADTEVEASALSALGATASQFGREQRDPTKTPFDARKAPGYLHTSIRNSVLGQRGILTNFFGSGGTNKANLGVDIHDPSLLQAASREREPLDYLIEREDRSSVGLGGSFAALPVSRGGTIPPLPPKAPAGPAPSDDIPPANIRGTFKGQRDVTKSFRLDELPALGKSLGLTAGDIIGLGNEVREVAAQARKLEPVLGGFTEVVIQARGGFAKVIGLRQVTLSPGERRSQQDAALVGQYEAGIAGAPAFDPRFPNAGRKLPAEVEDFQIRQLADAQSKYGDTYGVAGDVLYRNRREARAQAIGDGAAADFEARRRRNPYLTSRFGNTTPVDLLINQRASGVSLSQQYSGVLDARRREQEFARIEQTQREARVTNSMAQQQEDDINGRTRLRAANAAEGIGGVTDPLLLKQQALGRLSSGDFKRDPSGAREYLSRLSQNLSPLQYAQVERQYAGKIDLKSKTTPAVVGGANISGIDRNEEEFTQFAPDGYVERTLASLQARRAIITGTQRVEAQDATTQNLSQGSALGYTLAQRDKEGNLTGGLIYDNAKSKAQDRINARSVVGYDEQKQPVHGDILSQRTQATIRTNAVTDEQARTRAELMSAEHRLLNATLKDATSTERKQIVIENVEKAMQGLARVSRTAEGKILGLETSVARATAAGVSAPGAGGLGYALSGAKGRFSEGLGSLNQRITDSRFGKFFSGGAATASFLALPFATDQLSRFGGSAELAAEGDSSRYKSTQAATGALTLGLTGATIGGSVGGPVGAIVGGVVGAGIGIVTALQEAEKDIRQVKINNALTAFSDKLQALTSGIANFGAVSVARSSLKDSLGETAKKNREEATHFFGGFNLKEYGTLQGKSLRQDYGAQVPAIRQVLAEQASSLGKANLDRTSKGDVDGLVEQLKKGQGGFNQELLNLVANIQKIPVEEVAKEFRKAIVSAQQLARSERTAKTARVETEGAANQFGRLLLAVNAAADSLSGLRAQAVGLSDVFDGTISATKLIDRGSLLDQSGRNDNAALIPLNTIAAVGGEQGKNLRDIFAAKNDVDRVLPSILAEVAASGPKTQDDVEKQVRDGVANRLGFASPSALPSSVSTVLAGVSHELDKMQQKDGVGGFLDEARVDVTKLSQRLTAGQDPGVAKEIYKQIVDQGNELVSGLTIVANRVRAIGQTYDQLSTVRASNERQQIINKAESEGRFNQAIDFVPLSLTDRPFDERQRRLTGLAGDQALDPTAIRRRLDNTRDSITKAESEESRQKLFDRTGGKGGEFVNAANEVTRLKNEAGNLQQALRNLADVSERNAVIQDKLNRLQQERDSRLSFGERVLTADPAERAKLRRGEGLARQAAEQGSFEGFSSDKNRLAIDYLRSLGGATLTGFKGAPRADDLLKTLVENTGYGLNAEQKAEQTRLKGEQSNRGKTAEQALEELGKFQTETNDKFFATLTKQHEQFFTRLAAELVQNKLSDLEVKQGRAGAERSRLAGLATQRDALVAAGVRSTPVADALKSRTGDLQGLQSAAKENDRLSALFERAREAVDTTSFNPRRGLYRGREGGVQFLTDQGFTTEQAGQVLSYQGRSTPTPHWADSDGETNNQKMKAWIRTNLNKAANDATEKSLFAKPTEQENQARGALSGLQGVNIAELRKKLAGFDDQQTKAFFEGLQTFGSGGAGKFEALDGQIARTSEEFKKLGEEIANLRKSMGMPAAVVTRAGGGTTFKPQGSDTVPAMLTPGEFVVNARSAASNSSLLNQINNARGPIYRADGGPVNETERIRKLVEQAVRPAGSNADGYASVNPDGLSSVAPYGGPRYGSVSPDTQSSVAPTDGPRYGSVSPDTQSSIPSPGKYAAVNPDGRSLVAPYGGPRYGTVNPDGRSSVAPRKESPVSVEKADPAPWRNPGGFNRPQWIRDREEGQKPATNPGGVARADSRTEAELQFLGKSNPYSRSGGILAQRAAQARYAARQQAAQARSDAQRKRDQGIIARGEELKNGATFGKDNVVISPDGTTRGQTPVELGGDRIRFNTDLALAKNREKARLAREAVFQKSGGDTVAREQSAAKVAGAHRLAGSIVNFNERARAANVASSVNSTRYRQFDEQFKYDEDFRRYVQGRVGRPQGFAAGGVVPGSGVTDSIHALLTPGEVVMNRSAVSKVGAGNLQRLNQGGTVGGAGPSTSGVGSPIPAEAVQAMSEMSNSVMKFVQASGGFGEATQRLAQSFTQFGGTAQALTEALNAMPRTLNGKFTHEVNVNVSGAAALAQLKPELAELVLEATKSQLARILKEQMPDAGVQLG